MKLLQPGTTPPDVLDQISDLLPAPIPCDGCARPVRTLGGRPRKWCSNACRVRTTRQPYVPVEPTDRTCRFCDAPFSAKGYRFRCPSCQARKVMGRLRACVWCGDDFWPTGRPDRRFCDRNCASAWKADQQAATLPDGWIPRGKGHKDRARQYGVPYEVIDRHEVFERDGWLCMLCFIPVDQSAAWPDPRSASLDHIVPMSKGGGHLYTNVQCAHLFCNIAKGNGR